METKEAPARLWWTADKTELVPDGDPDARTLAASHAGKPIPADAKIRGEKAQAPAPNKAQAPAANKAQAQAGNKIQDPPTACPHCGKTSANFRSADGFEKHLAKFAGK